MIISRLIPVLLLKGRGLVKTLQFNDPKYLGDPMNIVKIFNVKEVDELIFLDISATKEKRSPDIDYIKKIAAECFMPFTYGGGITNIFEIKEIFKAGAEKVAINTALKDNVALLSNAAKKFGNQSIVASIDVKKDKSGYEVFVNGGRIKINRSLVDFVRLVEKNGAGEILLNSIDNDGMMQGYDIELIRQVTSIANIPVIATGGAGSIQNFEDAIHMGNANAVGAGSFFVFCGSRDSMLITYPERSEVDKIFFKKGI
ncbi:MAG: Imidazole glycerol phosphate synthase subunit HisF [uncultured bacterium]|nr:MAG: Imidazole glycerol phosphate synthase subunit HisF [uncultured bacterium]